MKFHHLTARTIPEAWQLLLGRILDKGEYHITPRGAWAGQDKAELDLVLMEIKQPWERPLIPLLPPGVPAETDEEHYEGFRMTLLEDLAPLFAALENGDIEKDESLEELLRKVSHAAPIGYNYYGHFVAPQMEHIEKVWKDKSQWDSNQMCIICGDETSLTEQDDPWIWKIYDFRIEEGKLNVITYFRSMESWGAFPRFLAAIQEGKEKLAKAIDAEDGEIWFLSKGVYILRDHWGLAQIMAMRNKEVPPVTDSFSRTKVEFDKSQYQKPMHERVKNE